MRRPQRSRVEQLIKDLGLREWKSPAEERAAAAVTVTEAERKRSEATRAARARFAELVKANVDAADTLHRELLAEGLRARIDEHQRGDLTRDG